MKYTSRTFLFETWYSDAAAREVYFSLRLVPDDTVHLSHTPPSLGTRGSSILDTDIASYSTTISFYYFPLFYSISETAMGDKPGGTAPTPNGQ